MKGTKFAIRSATPMGPPLHKILITALPTSIFLSVQRCDVPVEKSPYTDRPHPSNVGQLVFCCAFESRSRDVLVPTKQYHSLLDRQLAPAQKNYGASLLHQVYDHLLGFVILKKDIVFHI